MYANLNTTEKLVVEPSKKKGFRFLYKIVNKETNVTILTRYANRRFVAATISGNFFSSLTTQAQHEITMRATGAGAYVEYGYYCYIEDTTPFKTSPKLAFSLTPKTHEYAG